MSEDHVVTLSPDVTLLLDPCAPGLGAAMASGAYELAELACARRLVDTGDVVIDAGAHVGWYALPLARAVGPGGTVLAFEPFEASAARLRRAAVVNGLQDRLQVRSEALSDEPGPATLVCGTAPWAAPYAWLDPRSASDQGALDGQVRVPVTCTTIDALAFDGRCRLLKLDAEGSEGLILAGAERRLAMDRPAVICEIDHSRLAHVSGITADGLWDWLRNRGYSAYAIAFDGGTGPILAVPPTERVSCVLLLPGA